MTPSLNSNKISKKKKTTIRAFCSVLCKASRKGSLLRGDVAEILYLGGGLLKKGTLKVKRLNSLVPGIY